MKFHLFLMFFLFSIAHLRAIDDPKTIDFGNVSLDDAEKVIKQAEGGLSRREIVKSAIDSRRRDLFPLLLNDSETCYYLFKEVNMINDEELRDDVVVLMLKAEKFLWPHEGTQLDGSHEPNRKLMIEPFVGTIGRHLPNRPLNEELLSTRASRLKLAAELEAATGRKLIFANPPSDKHIKGNGQSEIPGTIPADSKYDEKIGLGKTNPKVNLEQSHLIRFLAWGFVILIVIGLLWLLIKRLK
jgi:hypothetical protein